MLSGAGARYGCCAGIGSWGGGGGSSKGIGAWRATKAAPTQKAWVVDEARLACIMHHLGWGGVWWGAESEMSRIRNEPN